ncbi:hypothetical protein IKR55_00885 [bacterium]|nr:hypothetical protein [bacterium]
MGLAERFKNRLAQKDIYSKAEETSKSVPTQYMTTTQPKYEYEDIEAKIIDKIRKTPYWNEYSTQKQESMINSYIDKKQTTDNPISPTNRKELIDNIMILSKNR